MTQDIAIVGMGCRFPHAAHVGEYWRNITDARVCFSEIPADRWNHALFYDPSPRAIDKTYARKVGLLDDVRSFSAMHYGLAPLRVSVMDPQHRLLLDTVRVALEDAGYREAGQFRCLAGSRTGVFVGASVSEYKDLNTARLRARALFDGQWGRAPIAAAEVVDAAVEDLTPLRAFTIAGNLLNMAAASVAQTFDFRGPAFTIDAACSSSLVATFDAVLSLRAKVCDVAIAGGVYLNLTPDNLVGFSRIGAISPSDACRPFDERSDGFVLGEGVGAVVLKRLGDALRDGDRIYAVIRGAGINNDGRGEGPMTPRLEGQLDAIACAHAEVDFTPDTIGFIEAHGTATAVGDATEIGALRHYFNAHARGRVDAVVSSVKANIGHTMSAAGVAGLIKASLVIERGKLPPQAAFARAHAQIGLDGSGFRVASDAAPFEANGPRRAAVSSFGFGGTNCHLVLEQAPVTAARRAVMRIQVPAGEAVPEAFVVSAPTVELLDGHLAAIRDAITARPELLLADVSRTLASRNRYDARVGFVARTHAELVDKLEVARDVARAGAARPGVWFAARPLDADDRKVAMLFPGQGAQTLGLCKALYDRYDGFRSRLDALAGCLDDILDRPLLSYLYPDQPKRNGSDADAMTALTATEVCQPAMAALGLAMFEFAESLGIEPVATIGHSLGEFAALAAAGALSSRDAVRFVARRGRVMADLALVDRGAMSAVQGDRGFVESYLDRTSREVVVANVNHPKQTVISGTTDGVLAAGARLAAAGATVTRLQVSHAFHSPLLHHATAPLADLVERLVLRSPVRDAISCIAVGRYPDEPAAMRSIMAAHATSTVDFVGGVRALAATGATILVQVAAGTTLLSMARATLRDAMPRAAVSLAGTDDDGTPFVEALVELAVLGVPVRLEAMHAAEAVSLAWLPPTPLPTEKYWVANRDAQREARGREDAKRDAVRAVVTTAGAAAPVQATGDLVTLFKQQMEVVQAHAEIMRRQVEALGSTSASRLAPVLAASVRPLAAPEIGNRKLEAGGRTPEAVGRTPDAASRTPTLSTNGVHHNGVHAPAAFAARSPKPEAPAAESDPRDDIEPKLLDLVAQVSAFPRASLQPSQRLVSDLGFDSLMIVELAGKASEAFPGLKGLPKTLFASGETTIADVTAHIAGTTGARRTAARGVAATNGTHVNRVNGSTAHAEPSALGRYTTRVDERPLAATPSDAIAPFAGPIAVLGRGPLASAVVQRLAAAGVTAETVSNDAALARTTARGVIDLRPLDGSTDAADARAATDAAFHTARALAPRLSPAQPTLFAVGYSHARDAAVAGFAKALAREWPDARVKAIAVDAATGADALVRELLGSDATVEVSLAGGRRRIVTLAASDITERTPLRDGAVVAITGGGRGLGARLAVELARRCHAKLVLLGRSSRDASIDQLIAAITAAGGEARYEACDVRDATAVATALVSGRKAFGGVEVVVHAAGVIADAVVTAKDPARFAEVFDTKVAGWLALERATQADPVRVALALTSWSGRFGNAEQTDYAAANHAVATLASAWHAARPTTRAVAVDLPPWDGTAMVSTIPAGARAVMRARGVTFLDDATGLAALVGELEASGEGASSGEVLLGHDVAIERDDHVRVRLSLATHPYLGDHRIDGVPVLPLASAADYVAAAGARVLGTPVDPTSATPGGVAGHPGEAGAFVIAELELLDGVRLDGNTPLELDVRARGRDDAAGSATGSGDALEVELAATATPGKLAYRARVSRCSGALAALDPPHALDKPPLALDEFYAKHIFHGPRMRGIVSVDGIDASHVTGVVRAARPGDLGERLTAFAIDPLVVDASFQLAAYFMLVRHRRAGLPLGFDELRVLAPIPSGARIHCTVRFDAQRGDLFAGHIDYRDDRGQLVAQLRGVRGAFKPVDGPHPSPSPSPSPTSTSDIPREHYTIEAFPEYLAIRARIDDVHRSGLDNPYFNVHEKVTADTALIRGRELVNFSNYNYLGLCGDPAVSKAAIDAITRYGTSVSASRIASGEKPLHRELEKEIAKFLGCEDSIVFVGGHATNVSVIGHIVGPGDLVIHDSLAHDSILGGIKLSGARRRPFPHNDWRALDEALRGVRGAFRRVLIAVEGVYSMDGDIPDLASFVEVKKRHKALMLVDEAHSLGVLGARGAGIGELYGVDRRDVELWMGTMSKALASCGGYIAGSAKMVEFLKYTNPGFVYSVGMSPPNAASALAALRELENRPELVAQLHARAKLFLGLCRDRGIDTGMSSGSAVVPCIIGDSTRCMLVANGLADAGINVQPIVYPAVEEHLSRLRFFISAKHTEAQLKFTADTLADIHNTFNHNPVRRPQDAGSRPQAPKPTGTVEDRP